MNENFSRFHQVLDSFQQAAKLNPGFYDEERVGDLLNFTAAAVRKTSAVFVLGETAPKAAHEYHGAIEIDFPFTTPFPVTVIEYDAPFDFDLQGKKEKTSWRKEVSILLSSAVGEITSLSFTKIESMWIPSGFFHQFIVEEKMLLCRLGVPTLSGHTLEAMAEKGISLDFAAQQSQIDISFMGAFLFQFLQILQCNNVKQRRELAPMGMDRKRRKQGLAPCFSFRTLYLQKERTARAEKEMQEDSRTSPRLHFRRGHVRRLAPEVRTWVSSCMVGDETSGEIKKVYSI